jgi:hypothetical protein
VGIIHDHFDVQVSRRVPDLADVDAVHEQMGGETLTQGMMIMSIAGNGQ